ncbi:MAG: hypothetical protein K1V87_00095 [Muribaculum sp.]
MTDITELFLQIIHQYKSVDIAEAEFKKMLHEDQDLREEYREWCDAVGSSEKMGFLDYCDEYMDSQESIYDTLNDYDE